MKYGEELTIHATPDSLSLSSVNSSKSAYCRFKYEASFFSRYNVGKPGDALENEEVEGMPQVNGQLLTKSLLSILKHRTVEKSAERCELSIVEGSPNEVSDNEEHDSLESKLVIKLHCKHGVVKTHRLLMLTPTALMAPTCPDSPEESKVTVGPRALKDVIDHFSVNKAAKSDPQLVWTFADGELTLRSSDSIAGNKGKEQLSTELVLSADEFEDYEISSPPITIAFHLREFNATIAFTDAMCLSMEMRFTEPALPLFIDAEGDSFECLFVLSTNQVAGATQSTNQTQASTTSNRKRGPDDSTHETPRPKKPMRAVQAAPSSSAKSASASRHQSRPPSSLMPPRSAGSANPFSQPPLAESTYREMHPPPVPARAWNKVGKQEPPSDFEEPLFLPCSQLSRQEIDVLRSTGLGIENMNEQELNDMLEGEGEEVDFSQPSQRYTDLGNRMDIDQLGGDQDSLDLVDEFGATQSSQSKGFQPLFED